LFDPKGKGYVTLYVLFNIFLLLMELTHNLLNYFWFKINFKSE